MLFALTLISWGWATTKTKIDTTTHIENMEYKFHSMSLDYLDKLHRLWYFVLILEFLSVGSSELLVHTAFFLVTLLVSTCNHPEAVTRQHQCDQSAQQVAQNTKYTLPVSAHWHPRHTFDLIWSKIQDPGSWVQGPWSGTRVLDTESWIQDSGPWLQTVYRTAIKPFKLRVQE